MIIAIDLRPLLGGNKSGVEIVTEQLVTHLINQGKEHHFILFINAWHKASKLLDQWKGPNITHMVTRIPNKALNLLLILLKWPKLDTLIAKKTGTQPDIYFLPDLRPAPVKKAKKILLMHDLAFHHFPEFFSLKTQYWYKFIQPHREIKSCAKLLAVSEHTKQDIIKTFHYEAKNIEVIPNAVEKNFCQKITDDNLKKVREIYNLPPKFFLFLGTIEPRKNINFLIKAFKKYLEEKKNDTISLVIAGKSRPDIFKENDLHISDPGLDPSSGASSSSVTSTNPGPNPAPGPHLDSNHKPAVESQITFIGAVKEEYKAALYKAATAVVYPSLWEGFGLPVLEALHCSTPVITSKTSGLPETGGDAVYYIDPYNLDSLTQAFHQILKPEIQERLRANSTSQLQKFSWDRSAKQLLKVFHEV